MGIENDFDSAPKYDQFTGSFYPVMFVMEDYGYGKLESVVHEIRSRRDEPLNYRQILAGTFFASYRPDVNYPPVSKIWTTEEMEAKGKNPLNPKLDYHINNSAMFWDYPKETLEFMVKNQMQLINPNLNVGTRESGVYWWVSAKEEPNFAFEIKAKNKKPWRQMRVSFESNTDTFDMFEEINAKVEEYYRAVFAINS